MLRTVVEGTISWKLVENQSSRIDSSYISSRKVVAGKSDQSAAIDADGIIGHVVGHPNDDTDEWQIC